MHTISLLLAAWSVGAVSTPAGLTTTQTTTYYGSSSISAAGSSSSSAGTSTVLIPATASTALPGNPNALPNPKPSAGTIAKLLSEDSRIDRFKEIEAEVAAGNFNLKFDFNPNANPPAANATKTLGGQVDLANRKNFPLLTGLGISAAAIFFQPCGLNTPHLHPDATEFLTVVTDSSVETGFILENGFVAEQRTNLSLFQGTAFPRGSIHWQQNLNCTPAVAIAGLNSEDPGASSIAQNFILNTSGDIVNATLGFPKQIDAHNFADFKNAIPAPLVQGLAECLVRCNIMH